MLTIQIQIRSVYGEEKAYPFNHEAECVARIAGTKTLTRMTLLHVLAMGATIVEMDRHGRESRRYCGAERSNLPKVA
jgi:hypothetical protein